MEIDYWNKVVLAPMVRVVSALSSYLSGYCFIHLFFFSLYCVFMDMISDFDFKICETSYFCNYRFCLLVMLELYIWISGHVAIQDAGCWIRCPHHVRRGDNWPQNPQMRATSQWFVCLNLCVSLCESFCMLQFCYRFWGFQLWIQPVNWNTFILMDQKLT